MCGQRTFYPPFHSKLGTGGTGVQAITQLARHCQFRPALPLNVWRHWGSPTIRLWGDDSDREMAIAAFENPEFQYPQDPVCVFCEKSLVGQHWDWFDLEDGNPVGPGCWGYDTLRDRCRLGNTVINKINRDS